MTEVNIMAIVRTIASGTAVVHIDDSCCAGLSREEMARRWAEVDRVIWQINRDAAERAERDGTPGLFERQGPHPSAPSALPPSPMGKAFGERGGSECPPSS